MTLILITSGIVVTFLTALVNFLSAIRSRKRIEEVHILVNSQLDAVVHRVAQLTEALEAADVAVPE